MTTDRKFAGFQRGDAPPFRMNEIPEGGMCLSSFVLLSNSEGKILMGKLDPAYDWDHIGAMDEYRKQRHSGGWIIPSCHLLMNESPVEAAERVVREQLGIGKVELGNGEIYSEVYGGSPDKPSTMHWDLEFVYRGHYDKPVTHRAWKELAYVDPNAPEEQFARSHQDILRNAGLRR